MEEKNINRLAAAVAEICSPSIEELQRIMPLHAREDRPHRFVGDSNKIRSSRGITAASQWIRVSRVQPEKDKIVVIQLVLLPPPPTLDGICFRPKEILDLLNTQWNSRKEKSSHRLEGGVLVNEGFNIKRTMVPDLAEDLPHCLTQIGVVYTLSNSVDAEQRRP